MYKFPEDFEVEKDYWIFCKQHENLNEAKENLEEIIRYGEDIPDHTLLDICRALHKLQKLKQSDYKRINQILFGYFKETSAQFSEYQDNMINYEKDKLS